jgi:hypothetical protein
MFFGICWVLGRTQTIKRHWKLYGKAGPTSQRAVSDRPTSSSKISIGLMAFQVSLTAMTNKEIREIIP